MAQHREATTPPINNQCRHVTKEQGLSSLPGPDPDDPTFATVLKTNASEVLFYAPQKFDAQEPHDRDEYYFVITGFGDFINGAVRHSFRPGDIIFVPAFQPHRFVDFSEDLAVWVIFYGPTEDSTYWSSEL